MMLVHYLSSFIHINKRLALATIIIRSVVVHEICRISELIAAQNVLDVAIHIGHVIDIKGEEISFIN